ncbi:hypothetical protein DRP53_00050 [candidate division WOR-3 bacterium]|uniref:HD domain-containing protein n=1 Tax=candidate division WOR-3 bacterium TaxID=2052148 RepID=A0A660SLY7_UNCW3|nr:MAG: hypothetical protein DRP53_00050 [candidate division WOR-3 bacterium]
MKGRIVSRGVLLTIGVLIYINLLFLPPYVTRKIELKEGDVAFEDIIAPFDFSIPKSEEEVAQERKSIEEKTPRVFVFDMTQLDQVRGRINGLIAQIDEIRKSRTSLGRKIDSIQKIIPLSQSASMELLSPRREKIFRRVNELIEKIMLQGYLQEVEIPTAIIYVQIGNREIPELVDNFYTRKKINRLLEKEPKPVRELILNLIAPNVLYNRERSQELLKEALGELRTTKGIVKKGEMIVGAHERVNHEIMEKINALNNIYSRTGLKSIFKFFLGRNLFFLIFIFFIKYYFDNRRRMFKDKDVLSFLIFIVIVYFSLTKLVSLTIGNNYAIPIAFAILFSYLYLNLEASVVLALILSLSTVVIFPELRLLVFLILSGVAASLIARMVQHRYEFYLNALVLAFVHVAVIILSHISLQPSESLGFDLAWGAANGFASSFIILLLLPLFEKLFSFTTDLTLLELANLNREVFKELALKAPGTYHHSIVVGNLAEAGARAIGANPILARVGAYYHDVGKLKKPEYFSENQLGQKNPHDQLTPEMSKLVIVNHVKEGVEMAKQMGLPPRVIRLIAEHHGTTVVEPFYLKALHIRGKISVDDFRYPGPRPSSIEAAIIMLADSVEAAARSAENITVSKLRKIIKDIFDKKFNDHQLDDCELTRKDLLRLQEAFFPILTGVFHPRVDYEDRDLRSRKQRKAAAKK